MILGAPRGAKTDPLKAGPPGEDPVRCRTCSRALAARGARPPLPDGRERGTFTNPAGHRFELLAFHEAPGTIAITPPSTAYAWFHGYAWQVALCRGCETHVGWRFAALAEDRPHFVALITDAVEGV